MYKHLAQKLQLWYAAHNSTKATNTSSK